MKKNLNTVKAKLMKSIVSRSVKAAEQNANSACAWWLNQLDPPKGSQKTQKILNTNLHNTKLKTQSYNILTTKLTFIL